MTGIGHDRDETVIDKVANTRVKTPTAAAEWLISQTQKADEQRIYLRDTIAFLLQQRILKEEKLLSTVTQGIPRLLDQQVQAEKNRIQKIQQAVIQKSSEQLFKERIHINNLSVLLPRIIEKSLPQERSKLSRLELFLRQAISYKIKTEKQHLDILGKTIDLTSPEHILTQGYSLTLKSGKVIRSILELHPGDKITTLFKDGEKESIII